jgi:hypothetical protein
MKIKTYHDLQLVVGVFPTIQRSTCNTRRIDTSIYCTYCISRNSGASYCCTFATENVHYQKKQLQQHANMELVKNSKKLEFQTKMYKSNRRDCSKVD